MKVQFDENSCHSKFWKKTYDARVNRLNDKYPWKEGVIDGEGYVIDGEAYRNAEPKSLPPPNNLCPYFWQVAIAFFALPFSWLGYILAPYLNRSSIAADIRGFWGKVGAGFISQLAVFLVGLMIYNLVILFVSNPASVLSAILALALIGGLTFGVIKIAKNDKIKTPSSIKNIGKKVWELPSAFLKAKKEKLCPIIEWKEKK